MSATVERLVAALADRYRIERELGGGGMSRVFVADEVALGCTVVEDARLLGLDPFFASVRREPRYLALTAAMTQDVSEMRKRTAAAHPSLFTPPSAPRP